MVDLPAPFGPIIPTIPACGKVKFKLSYNNLSPNAFQIEPGERVAQLVFAKVEIVEWLDVNNISSTDRGVGGFGHTGR